MNSIQKINEFLSKLSIRNKYFNIEESKLKLILPLFPFIKNLDFSNEREVIVIPLGICIKTSGKVKLHFNLLLTRNSSCWRFEPHSHISMHYEESKLDKYLKSKYKSYFVKYGNGVGRECVKDAFEMVDKFLNFQ